MCIGLNIYHLMNLMSFVLATLVLKYLFSTKRNVGLCYPYDFECNFSILLCLLMIKLFCCSAVGDFSAVDMAYALTNGAGNFEVTPESLRSVLPLINWDKISAMYLPGRSGAECESRYFFFLNTFICSCTQHDLSLLPFISHYCMFMM